MIAFECPSCAKSLKVRDELAGKRVKCPGCQKAVVVPQPVSSLSPPPSMEERTLPPSGQAASQEPEQRTLPPGKRAQGDSLADAGGHTDLGGHQGEQTQAVGSEGSRNELTEFLAPAEKPDELGRLGGYRILKILGHGGMGVVFQAEDPKLGRKVAIKAMLPDIAASKSAQQRFLREAKAAATLEHPHIVPIFHVGEDRGAPFIVMPFLKGEPLDERLRREKVLPPEEVARIGRQVAEGLAAAHDLGLMHRDIKPANIWLESVVRGSSSVAKKISAAADHGQGTTDQVRILDFGLARAATDTAGLTQTGAIIGTPQYMAPEQAAGEKDIDHRCDLFSLGCVLYRMATGQLPFQGENTLAIISALAMAEPKEPSLVGVPAALSNLIMHLLEKKPADRPQSAHEVAEALAEVAGKDTALMPAPKASKTSLLQRPRSLGSRRKKVLIGSALAVLVAGFLAAVAVIRFRASEEKITEAQKTDEPVASGPVHLPHWVERKWIEDASQLPAEEQVGVVRTKLQERNPTYDGNFVFKIDDGRVVEVAVWTDKVFELSPLRAFTGLRKLDCRGSGAGKSILQDLSPLQGLPLTVLNLQGCTQVYDLSPLHGLKLAVLDCDSTAVTNLKPLAGQPLRVLQYPQHSWLGAEPLRSIKTLETINSHPAATFWKMMDRDAAEFEKFRRSVALLSAADQVKEVTARLKLKNPGFAAMPTSTIDPGTGSVKEFVFPPTQHIVDLSPVRAFPRLERLSLESDLGKSKLVDLTPLQGMKLTSLILHACEQVGDLTPLQGMPLTSLNLEGCRQVRDLTPLRGMPLTSLLLGHNPVRDLTPLQGMKLTTLGLGYSGPVRDLTPLRGMPLTVLDIAGYNEVPDFALLQEMPLTELHLANCGQLRDLTPLRGMKLTSLGLNGCRQVRDLTPLKGMKLQALFAETTGVQDLTPLADMPLEVLDFTPKNITRGIEVIQRMTTLKRIKHLQAAEFWKKYKAGEFGKPDAPVQAGAVHLPHWVERKWIEDVSQLPAEQQVVAVRGKLQERNPGYDGKADPEMDGDRVVGLNVVTDKVFELSPLRAFTGLRRLDCRGNEGKSILQDLSPLQGLPLTGLNLNGCTQVYDLSPLHGMKLAELHCASTLVTNLKPLVGQPLRVLNYPYRSWPGAEPLRSIKTLETINGQPAAAFWKIVDGEAAEFEKFRKFVALLPAADQVKEVSARLKIKNPGFAAMPTSTIDQGTGTVKQIAFPTEHVVDLSPVHAFPRLQILHLGSEPEKSKLVDLTPLQGMKLTSLYLGHCDQVRDLTPLQGMPLTSLYLGHCDQVRDLTPLQGMPLTTLELGHCQMRDLTPLQGMKLTSLNLNYCPHLRDLTPLQGMPLTSLNLGGHELSDLALLQGMKLTYLNLMHCRQVRDLSPLHGMPLIALSLNACTQVRDLTPLKGMKLQTLYALDTGVQDLTPLADMPLEELSFTPKNITRGIEVIQRMTTLKKIDGEQWPARFTPAEFWKKYKAGEFGK